MAYELLFRKNKDTRFINPLFTPPIEFMQLDFLRWDSVNRYDHKFFTRVIKNGDNKTLYFYYKPILNSKLSIGSLLEFNIT